MEESTSWKGHAFTLLVFTGIVVLCAIFFTLGMLVGRAQGQKMAAASAAEAATKAEARVAPKEEKSELTFFDSVEKEPEPPSLESPLPDAKPEPVAAEPVPELVSPADIINYQIAALKSSSEAEKLLEEVKERGFRAFIIAPPADEANPYFRIQVGPFSDMSQADDARSRLEAAGFQPILKK